MLIGKILIVVVLFGTFNVMGQKVYFSHDNAGNQIKRSIRLGSLRKGITDSAAVKAEIDNFSVIVYPNPTQGKLQIEISNFPKDSICTYSIANLNGSIIVSQKLTISKTEADLSMQSTGLYIMNVSIGRKRLIWKIIKE